MTSVTCTYYQWWCIMLYISFFEILFIGFETYSLNVNFHPFIILLRSEKHKIKTSVMRLIIYIICLSSDHHVHKLLQRKLGHRSTKFVYGCEAGSCFRGGRRGCVQDHPGTYWTLSELFWKHDHKHGWRGDGVLLGTVGVRWLEQSQLRHRRNKKPFEVIIILYNNSRYLYMSTPAK